MLDKAKDPVCEMKVKKSEPALAHIDSIYRFALYMIQDEEEAQNLVIYTYLKAYESFDSFNDGKSCRIRLLAILNDAITEIGSIFSGAIERDNQNTDSNAVSGSSRIRLGEIAAAMSKLPATDRAIVLLSDMERLSCEDIANIVGRSVEDVSSRLFRGRKLLIERLKVTLNSVNHLLGQSQEARPGNY